MGTFYVVTMVWCTRSCFLWIAAISLLHLTNLGIAEENVQELVDVDTPALPRVAQLKDGLMHSSRVSSVKLGDSQRSAKNYDTPEEEMKALATEDHDANIKAMEMAEHLKATERAKEAEVPEDVICYHDLVIKAKNQMAMAERLEEEAKDAAERLKSATHLKEETAAAAQKLKRRMERDQKSKTDAEEQYRKEHSTALNAFEAARGNLDNYNNDRKKVDLDSTRSKQVLTKYLEYKKKFIEASANADDPTQSKEVAQYRKLSEQYLTSYHALQAKIQESYTSAQRESDLYQQLSQRYQKIAGDANDIAAEVSKTSADLLKSRKAHKEKQKEYEEHAAEAQKWEQTHAQKKETAAPKEKEADAEEPVSEPHVVLASALQLLQQEPVEYSAEDCSSDKAVSTQNLEAAEKAKLAHQAELTHLHVLKEDH